MQIRVHFCLTLYVRSRLDRIRLSTKLTGVKVEPATLSFNIDRQINIVALFLSVLVLERGFCVENIVTTQVSPLVLQLWRTTSRKRPKWWPRPKRSWTPGRVSSVHFLGESSLTWRWENRSRHQCTTTFCWQASNTVHVVTIYFLFVSTVEHLRSMRP